MTAPRAQGRSDVPARQPACVRVDAPHASGDEMSSDGDRSQPGSPARRAGEDSASTVRNWFRPTRDHPTATGSNPGERAASGGHDALPGDVHEQSAFAPDQYFGGAPTDSNHGLSPLEAQARAERMADVRSRTGFIDPGAPPPPLQLDDVGSIADAVYEYGTGGYDATDARPSPATAVHRAVGGPQMPSGTGAFMGVGTGAYPRVTGPQRSVSGGFGAVTGDHAAATLASDAHETVRYGRLVASSLGTLVRACRTESPQMAAMSQQLRAQWAESGWLTLTVRFDGLEVDDETVLDARDRLGDWVHPAWLAGLRTVTLSESATASDVAALGALLARLDGTANAVVRLSDAMYFGHLASVELTTAPCVFHVAALAYAPRLATAQVPPSLDGRAASILLEWEQLGEERRSEAPVPLPRLTGDDVATARAAIEDEAAWLGREADFAIAHGELRALLPGEALGDRFADATRRPLGAWALEVLSMLRERGGAWGAAAVARVDLSAACAAVARGSDMPDTGAMRALRGVLLGADQAMARGVATGLLERGAEDPAAARPIAALFNAAGAQRFVGLLDAERLSADALLFFARLVAHVGADGSAVATMVAHLRPEGVAALVPHLTADMVAASATELLVHLARGGERSAGTVAGALMHVQHGAGAAVLAEAMARGAADRWPTATTQAAARCIVALGRGADLVAVARDGDRPEELRVTALHALERSPDDLAAALRKRAGDMLDPPRVKEARRTLRRMLEGGGR